MTTQHRIRDYLKTDFVEVAHLWDKAVPGGVVSGNDASVVWRTLEHGRVFLVMEEASTGKIIGTSWMTNDFRRMYLHHFGILPESQDCGLAA
ncbi:MAG: hypothetical protein CVU43_18615 [Chloroflexi bacterium HGW-Chloroflexi-5]|jgi:hypothetical protein|nr:MAG: hypothetical protein CVU43_18615 [Chloroflexi bacterium HGW-Chloroflexi-5]